MAADSPGEQVKPRLEIDTVSVRFGGVSAVRDVSLSIRPGEIVAIIGANGAGNRWQDAATLAGGVQPTREKKWATFCSPLIQSVAARAIPVW